jgi:1,4-alpha-glucan branching enzyme
MVKANNAKAAGQPTKTSVKKGATKKPSKKTTRDIITGMKKEYLKSRKVCKVTFRFPRIAAPGAKSVCIVGDFNDWNIYANPMKRLKQGDFTITLELEPGREYQFRYLVDGSRWENDWNADKYVKSPFGDSDNSVIVL